jgi:hypothetical protein
MTGLLTLSGDPSTSLQAATKQYVDAQALAAVAGLDIKPSVVNASTGNIALTAEQTIDGVLTSGSRILLKNQTAPAENGIWLTGSGAWSRVTDMDAWTEVPGAVVVVESGTLWADTVWMCTANAGGTLNTTAITWRRIDNQPLRNAQVGTTYTVLADDHGRHITTSNGSAIATTLPQATTTFGNGFEFLIENLGAGANTITPTTSTINGAATLILRTGDAYKVTSDGTNYRAVPHGLTYAQLVALTADGTGATGDLIVTGDISATNLKQMTLATTQTLFTASQAQQETGSSTAVNVTPGRQHFHPSAAKCWLFASVAGGVPTMTANYNMTSITDDGVAQLSGTIATDFSSATWASLGTGGHASDGYAVTMTAKAAGTFSMIFKVTGSGFVEPTEWNFSGFGDLA